MPGRRRVSFINNSTFLLVMDDARKDPDWIAYRTDLGAGKLDHYRGQFVAYCGGTFLTHAPTQDELLRIVRTEFFNLMDKGKLIQKVGEVEEVPIPTFSIE